MIAIFDIFNQDIGLKLLFGPVADYYVLNEENITIQSRTKTYTKYNFCPKYDFHDICPEKYPILMIIGSTLDYKKMISTHQNIVEKIISKYETETTKTNQNIYWFDNHDYDYDPAKYYDSPAICKFFKRNYNSIKSTTYSEKVVAYPYIMFGHESIIEKCIEIPKFLSNHRNLQSSKVDEVYFAGSPFQHNDISNNVVRNRHDFLLQIYPYLNLSMLGRVPYEEYLKNIIRSKFALDLLGVGEPNKRTFEILFSQALMLSEAHQMVWPFEQQLGERLYTEHTSFRTAEEFVRVLKTLRRNPALYEACLARQKEIVKKFFTVAWIRHYLMKNLRPEHNLSIVYKVLLINKNFHHKNLAAFLRYRHLQVHCVLKIEDCENVDEYDVIYSPAIPFDVAEYGDFRGKFVFGPHFSTFPEEPALRRIVGKQSVYIQPSEWASDAWQQMRPDIFNNYMDLKIVPFAVDTDKFSEDRATGQIRNKIMIYYKSRSPEILQNVMNYCSRFLQQFEYKVFSYRARYTEQSYIDWLKQSRFGIVIDAHESQGFAVLEALSSNVPLVIIGARYMSDELGSTYPNIPCTTVPYWDKRCGEVVYDYGGFEGANGISLFLKKLQQNMYQPRQYILDNLTADICEQHFISALV